MKQNRRRSTRKKIADVSEVSLGNMRRIARVRKAVSEYIKGGEKFGTRASYARAAFVTDQDVYKFINNKKNTGIIDVLRQTFKSLAPPTTSPTPTAVPAPKTTTTEAPTVTTTEGRNPLKPMSCDSCCG